MISDYVKGKKRFDYPDDIQKGIQLHRMIDAFTDAHEAVHEAKQFFRPVYRLYSGAMVDVVFDHFLAIDEIEFPGDSLFKFSHEVYEKLDQQQPWFPEKFAQFYPHMKQYNWLYNYRTLDGAAKSLGGVVRRARYLTESESAVQVFRENYKAIGDCYRHFWTFAKPFARHRFNEFTQDSPRGIV